jgi:putative DNA primase/helicase
MDGKTPERRTPLHWARIYAELEWPVFSAYGVRQGHCACDSPDCIHPGKHPSTRHGFKDATADMAQIKLWWTRAPLANVAIATGRLSGVLVLDVDPRNGGNESLADLLAEFGPLPPTATALTGGDGQHYYFAHPGGYVKSRTLRPGLDFKADGGYVIAPPSLHISGRRYEWEVGHAPDEVALARLPGWLVQSDTPSRRDEPLGPATRIAQGSRNAELASLAGSMRRRGMTKDEIAAALHAANEGRCDPPLPRKEVDRIADSIARYEPTPFPTLLERRARQRARMMA